MAAPADEVGVMQAALPPRESLEGVLQRLRADGRFDQGGGHDVKVKELRRRLRRALRRVDARAGVRLTKPSAVDDEGGDDDDSPLSDAGDDAAAAAAATAGDGTPLSPEAEATALLRATHSVLAGVTIDSDAAAAAALAATAPASDTPSLMRAASWEIMELLVPRLALSGAPGTGACTDLVYAAAVAGSPRETYLVLLELLYQFKGDAVRGVLSEMMALVLLRWDSQRSNFMSAGMGVVFDSLIPRAMQSVGLDSASDVEATGAGAAEGSEAGGSIQVKRMRAGEVRNTLQHVRRALAFIAPLVEQCDINRPLFAAMADDVDKSAERDMVAVVEAEAAAAAAEAATAAATTGEARLSATSAPPAPSVAGMGAHGVTRLPHAEPKQAPRKPTPLWITPVFAVDGDADLAALPRGSADVNIGEGDLPWPAMAPTRAIVAALRAQPAVPGGLSVRQQQADACVSLLLRLVNVVTALPEDAMSAAMPSIVALLGWCGVTVSDVLTRQEAKDAERARRATEREEAEARKAAGKATLADNAFGDDSSDDSEGYDERESAWNYASAGGYVYATAVLHCGPLAIPTPMSPAWLLSSSLRYALHLLNVVDSRLCGKGASLVAAVAARAQSADLAFAKRPAATSLDKPLGLEEQPLEMQVVGRLSDIAVLCSDAAMRNTAFKALTSFVACYRPSDRWWMLHHAIDSCPYNTLVAQLIDIVRRNAAAEQLPSAASAGAAAVSSAGAGAGAGAGTATGVKAVVPFASPFASPELMRVVWTVLDRKLPLSSGGDVYAATLSLVYFVLARGKAAVAASSAGGGGGTGADPFGVRDDPAVLKRLRTKLLEPVGRDVALRVAEFQKALETLPEDDGGGGGGDAGGAGPGAQDTGDGRVLVSMGPEGPGGAPKPPEKLTRRGAMEGLQRAFPMEAAVSRLRAALDDADAEAVTAAAADGVE